MNSKMKKFLKPLMIPVAAVLIALVVGAIIIALTGSNPIKAYVSLLQGNGIIPKKSYANFKGQITDFMKFIDYVTPMIFAALAVCVALRCGLFNIGVSGQMLISGFTATVLVGYSNMSAVPAKILVVLISILVGALAGSIIGFLKFKFNINEVVSTIMFNYIFQYVISFLINTYYVDPVSRQSKMISTASRLTLVDMKIRGYKIDIPLGIILALLAVVFVSILLNKTKLGYELKAVGYSRNAAYYAGINVGKSMVIAMVISGALAGLAGATLYLGYVGSIQPKVLADTGYTAIAVSLLGNNNPYGIVFSSMLISIIENGGTYMKSSAGVETEIASVITGIILIFSASNAFVKHWLAQKNANRLLKQEKKEVQ